jgi:hypothetical protein
MLEPIAEIGSWMILRAGSGETIFEIPLLQLLREI